MVNKNRQLLCTFSDKNSYYSTISKIRNHYSLGDDKFFVFVNSKSLKEYYITYNITTNPNTTKFPFTISLHRKKETNTLYTLNGMNRLITDENNGVFERNYKLDWELYRNSLILTTDDGPKIVTLELVEIYKN